MNLFLTSDIGKDIKLHTYNTDKFKTTTICFYIHNNLDESAAFNALLPRVLKNGSSRFPNTTVLSEYLEELYGSVFEVDVIKKGEVQSILFYLSFINDRYIQNEAIFDKAVGLLTDIILNPITEENGFKAENVIKEKNNLKEQILSRMNDKVQYAVERCMEIVCKGDPFEIYRYGSLEILDKINPENLYEHYKRILHKNPIDIYIVGDVSNDKVLSLFKEKFDIKRDNTIRINGLNILSSSKETQIVNESMDINQGKLCLGYRTYISFADKRFPALSIYTSILGGGLHSKLFQNLREKESLAYYAYSGIEKFKGLMLINSGIEVENYDKAVRVVQEQVEDMRKGNITEYEIQSSIKKIMSDLKAITDNVPLMIDYNLGGIVHGKEVEPQEIMKSIESVEKQQIVEVAEKIVLDTVFFLKPKDME